MKLFIRRSLSIAILWCASYWCMSNDCYDEVVYLNLENKVLDYRKNNPQTTSHASPECKSSQRSKEVICSCKHPNKDSEESSSEEVQILEYIDKNKELLDVAHNQDKQRNSGSSFSNNCPSTATLNNSFTTQSYSITNEAQKEIGKLENPIDKTIESSRKREYARISKEDTPVGTYDTYNSYISNIFNKTGISSKESSNQLIGFKTPTYAFINTDDSKKLTMNGLKLKPIQSTTAYQCDDEKCIFVESSGIYSFVNTKDLPDYTVCVHYPNSCSSTSSERDYLWRLSNEHTNILLWKSKQSIANQDKERLFNDIMTTGMEFIKQQQYDRNTEENNSYFFAYRFNITHLNNMKPFIKSRNNIILYLDYYCLNDVIITRMFLNTEDKSHLKIILDQPINEMPGYISFTTTFSRSITKKVMAIIASKRTTQVDKLTSSSSAIPDQNTSSFENSSKNESNPTEEENSHICYIKTLSIINPMAFTVSMRFLTSILLYVTDDFNISFTVWLHLLNDTMNALNQSNNFKPGNAAAEYLDIKTMTIYPFLQNEQVYNAKTFNTCINVAKSKHLQHYATMLTEFLNVAQTNICASYIQLILYATKNIIYSKLTKITFYAYNDEMDNICKAIPIYIKSLVLDNIFEQIQTAGNTRKQFPVLKTIEIIFIPKDSDHTSFKYDESKGHIKKVFDVSTTSQPSNTQATIN
ncbi:hypothetical protein NEOKW01_1965 [Nematocida sp. AWRm80]|nr:hypothetical protein NEOKW01_1965 [Nematocida sp. AWRm80]